MNERGYVYFIQPASGGSIKIGYSKDPQARLRELMTGSAQSLVLLGAMPGTRADERRLHSTFHEDRVQGEWFAPSKPLCSFIRRTFKVRPKGEPPPRPSGPEACLDCGKPCREGEMYCEECSYCVECGSPLYEGDELFCSDCEMEAAIEEGRCSMCGESREDPKESVCYRCLPSVLEQLDDTPEPIYA